MATMVSRRIHAPVQGILLVDEFTRARAIHFKAASPPGHLLHLVETGHVRQLAEGRVEVLRPGDLVWYHQDEPVEGRILRAPWRFITVSFLAPDLAPPPDNQRVRRASARTMRGLRALLQAWRDESGPRLARELRCMSLLQSVLLDLLPDGRQPPSTDATARSLTQRWWQAEKLLRERLEQPMRLADMARRAGFSIRTAVRACRLATGLPPARRLKAIRMSHAQNLLQLTDLTVTEIAMAVGYSRVQEFSRDFHRQVGQPPRQYRTAPRAARRAR